MKQLLNCLIIAYFSLTLIACGGQNSTVNNPNIQSDINSAAKSDYELLFIGNSHSSLNDLPELVAKLIIAGTSNKTVNTFNAPGWQFLDERIGDGVTQPTLEAREWTHVFLQAQKYSTTGLYYYSTDAAEEWVRRVKTQNALPIMFPEWPRKNNFEEGARIHQLHHSIASVEPACVAPVGLAWDLSIARYPTLNLHSSDDNHSNLNGALLTAFVFYEVLTGNLASELGYVDTINVSQTIQAQLKEIATETIAANPACPYF